MKRLPKSKLEALRPRPAWIKPTTRVFYGRVCEHHPELGGARRGHANGACFGCKRETSRYWYEANTEHARETARRWREENAEHAREKSRRWREANPGRHSENNRRWREANPEYKREILRRWHVANPEKANAAVARRRAAKRGAAIPLSPKEQAQMLLLEQVRRRLGLTLDHAVPFAGCRRCGAAGLHHPKNLALMSSKNNDSKGARCPSCWIDDAWSPEEKKRRRTVIRTARAITREVLKEGKGPWQKLLH